MIFRRRRHLALALGLSDGADPQSARRRRLHHGRETRPGRPRDRKRGKFWRCVGRPRDRERGKFWKYVGLTAGIIYNDVHSGRPDPLSQEDKFVNCKTVNLFVRLESWGSSTATSLSNSMLLWYCSIEMCVFFFLSVNSFFFLLRRRERFES